MSKTYDVRAAFGSRQDFYNYFGEAWCSSPFLPAKEVKPDNNDELLLKTALAYFVGVLNLLDL